MAEKNVDSLNLLFDEKAMFVHMGGSWGKQPELSTIKTGGIWYKTPIFKALVEIYRPCILFLLLLFLLSLEL